ncbi:MAG: peptidylprolyl isomerase [Vicinamibacterales bacterium]
MSKARRRSSRRPLAAIVVWAAALAATALVAGQARQATPPAAPGAAPVLVFETAAKGTFQMQFFAADAPKSVEHLVGLVKQNFYRGLRFHRAEARLVQIGDPQTRNVSLKNIWGTGNSGTPIGVSEVSRKHLHVRGAVGLAHGGNPAGADSQFYIMKSADTSLDGKYCVVGQVTAGMEVVDKIEVGDVLKQVTIK